MVVFRRAGNRCSLHCRMTGSSLFSPDTYLQVEPDHPAFRLGLSEPSEELGEAVDLIIILAGRKKRHFALATGRPERGGGNGDPAGLDHVQHTQHARCLVVSWDDTFDRKAGVRFEVLDQLDAGSRLFDQDALCSFAFVSILRRSVRCSSFAR